MKKVVLLVTLLFGFTFAAPPKFATPINLTADGSPIGSSSLTTNGALSPGVFDWDEDGDLDLLVGIYGPFGGIIYYENIGTSQAPEFTERGYMQADGSNIKISVW